MPPKKNGTKKTKPVAKPPPKQVSKVEEKSASDDDEYDPGEFISDGDSVADLDVGDVESIPECDSPVDSDSSVDILGEPTQRRQILSSSYSEEEEPCMPEKETHADLVKKSKRAEKNKKKKQKKKEKKLAEKEQAAQSDSEEDRTVKSGHPQIAKVAPKASVPNRNFLVARRRYQTRELGTSGEGEDDVPAQPREDETDEDEEIDVVTCDEPAPIPIPVDLEEVVLDDYQGNPQWAAELMEEMNSTKIEELLKLAAALGHVPMIYAPGFPAHLAGENPRIEDLTLGEPIRLEARRDPDLDLVAEYLTSAVPLEQTRLFKRLMREFTVAPLPPAFGKQEFYLGAPLLDFTPYFHEPFHFFDFAIVTLQGTHLYSHYMTTKLFWPKLGPRDEDNLIPLPFREKTLLKALQLTYRVDTMVMETDFTEILELTRLYCLVDAQIIYNYVYAEVQKLPFERQIRYYLETLCEIKMHTVYLTWALAGRPKAAMKVIRKFNNEPGRKSLEKFDCEEIYQLSLKITGEKDDIRV